MKKQKRKIQENKEKKESSIECPVFEIYKVSRKMIKAYTENLEGFELTYPQYLAMLYLWKRDKVSVDEIGEELLLDSGTLTPLLKRLEAKGFLTRGRDPKDERKCIIALSDKGLGLKTQVKEVREKVAKYFNLDPEVIKRLKSSLKEILDVCENK